MKNPINDEKKINQKSPKFEMFIDMREINDSMLIDSNTTIASLALPNGDKATIEVQGDIKVEFEGKYYQNPSEFPATLKDLIKNSTFDNPWYENDKVIVWENNWFEVFYIKNGTYMPESDCVDIENSTEEELYNILADFINECEEKEVVPVTYQEYIKKYGEKPTEKSKIGEWIQTDDLQYVRKINDTTFEVAEVIGSQNAGYKISHQTVNLNDYDKEVIERVLDGFGYGDNGSIESVKRIYGDSCNQIIAECIAETFRECIPYLSFRTEEKALKHMLKNIVRQGQERASKEPDITLD